MERNKASEKSRLGRGLSALIPSSPINPGVTDQAGNAGEEIEKPRELPVSSIVPNAFQPRVEFDSEALDELTNSIIAHGVLQPILVRPSGKNRYELIAGERRYRAAQKAGLKAIPAIIREFTDEESLTVALIENIQREDLNAIEAARGYRQLIDQFGLTQSALASQIGKAQPTIANALRLLKLQPEIQESIIEGKITEEHGKALLSIEDEEIRSAVWQIVVERQLSVAETRRLCQDSLKAHTAKNIAKREQIEKDVHWIALEDRIRSAFGLKVGLKPTVNGGGTLTITFSNPDEIVDILEKVEKVIR